MSVRANVVFKPTTPQSEDGIRTEPATADKDNNILEYQNYWYKILQLEYNLRHLCLMQLSIIQRLQLQLDQRKTLRYICRLSVDFLLSCGRNQTGNLSSQIMTSKHRVTSQLLDATVARKQIAQTSYKLEVLKLYCKKCFHDA